MKLLPEDTILLSTTGSNNETQEELIFFEKLRNKMENEPAWSNDLLLSETDNEDGLYIVRCYDHEFIIGRYVENGFHDEIHVMSLKEAMETSLHLLGLECDLSLLDWLRRRNFKNIRYNNNFDIHGNCKCTLNGKCQKCWNYREKRNGGHDKFYFNSKTKGTRFSEIGTCLGYMMNAAHLLQKNGIKSQNHVFRNTPYSSR